MSKILQFPVVAHMNVDYHSDGLTVTTVKSADNNHTCGLIYGLLCDIMECELLTPNEIREVVEQAIEESASNIKMEGSENNGQTKINWNCEKR